MNHKTCSIFTIILLVFVFAGYAGAHCEIPCGIYDDELRIKLIGEHIDTIEKSIKQVLSLEKQSPVNYNQLVRWINNKEAHASEIQHIVSQYFMTQRIKVDAKAYARKISLLHQMLVQAMRCKQTTDLENVAMLRSLLNDFSSLYFAH